LALGFDPVLVMVAGKIFRAAFFGDEIGAKRDVVARDGRRWFCGGFFGAAFFAAGSGDFTAATAGVGASRLAAGLAGDEPLPADLLDDAVFFPIT